jgi:hypothetical protein
MIKTLDRGAIAAAAVAGMGLDQEVSGIDSPEALAAAIRRAASFSCPTTQRELSKAVVESLEWLVSDPDSLAGEVTASLEAVINYGDLLDLSNIGGKPSKSSDLYLAPPSFVVRRSGAVLLIGIATEGQPIVGEELSQRVVYERHVRSIMGPAGPQLLEDLADDGLRHVAIDQWLACPRPLSATELITLYDARLSASIEPGPIDGLSLLDAARSVAYYRGRWRPPTSQDEGRFVARRPREYGADLWCYVELRGGVPTGLIDLPIGSGIVRGCDEAWRLQGAIDAVRGHPQTARYSPSGASGRIVQLTLPTPSWLQRRWDAVGIPVVVPGALVSYRFETKDLQEELDFAETMLWTRTVA